MRLIHHETLLPPKFSIIGCDHGMCNCNTEPHCGKVISIAESDLGNKECGRKNMQIVQTGFYRHKYLHGLTHGLLRRSHPRLEAHQESELSMAIRKSKRGSADWEMSKRPCIGQQHAHVGRPRSGLQAATHCNHQQQASRTISRLLVAAITSSSPLTCRFSLYSERPASRVRGSSPVISLVVAKEQLGFYQQTWRRHGAPAEQHPPRCITPWDLAAVVALPRSYFSIPPHTLFDAVL